MPTDRANIDETAKGENGAAPSSREKLMAACERIIAAEGFAAITSRRLAREAQTNLALISYNFGGISGLLQQVAQDNLELTAGNALTTIRSQSGDRQEQLHTITEAVIRSLWTPAIHSGVGRSSSVVEEIYAQGPESLRQALADRISDLFLELVELYAPLVPHLSRRELILRLTCIGGAIRSMSERSTAWDIYFGIVGGTADATDELAESVAKFALAALEV